MSIEDKKFLGMTPKEFQQSTEDICEWVKWFCRHGKEMIRSEEDYLTVFFHIAFAFMNIAEVSDEFATVAEKYCGEAKDKSISITPTRHLS